MKTLENLNGIQLYESTDSLPEKWINNQVTRLTVGKKYKVIGACRVPESKNKNGDVIKPWDGILIENVITGKRFPVGIASLTGTGFIKNEDASFTLVRTSSISFNSIEDILATDFFTVSAGEKLRVTDFSGKLIDKDFYHFSDFVFLTKDKIPTFAKNVPTVETAKRSTKKA